jgi:hypothetical protein
MVNVRKLVSRRSCRSSAVFSAYCRAEASHSRDIAPLAYREGSVQSEKMGFAGMGDWGKVFPQSSGTAEWFPLSPGHPSGRPVASVDAPTGRRFYKHPVMTLGWDAHMVFPRDVARLPFRSGPHHFDCGIEDQGPLRKSTITSWPIAGSSLVDRNGGLGAIQLITVARGRASEPRGWSIDLVSP